MSGSKKILLFINIYRNIWQLLIDLRLKTSKILNELSIEQFIALNVIYMNKDITQTELSKKVSRDFSNTSRLISSLEDNGFVNRLIGTKNNRLIKKLSLTQKGKKVFKEVNETLLKSLKEISEEEIESSRIKTKQIEIILNKVLGSHI